MGVNQGDVHNCVDTQIPGRNDLRARQRETHKGSDVSTFCEQVHPVTV